MKNIVRLLFTVFISITMVGGTLLVLGQSSGIIIQNGSVMIKSLELFGNTTFISAAIAGFIGYIYSYFPNEEAKEKEVEENNQSVK